MQIIFVVLYISRLCFLHRATKLSAYYSSGRLGARWDISGPIWPLHSSSALACPAARFLRRYALCGRRWNRPHVKHMFVLRVTVLGMVKMLFVDR